jgi:hypothetical protein
LKGLQAGLSGSTGKSQGREDGLAPALVHFSETSSSLLAPNLKGSSVSEA